MDALIRVHPRPLSCPCLKLAGYLAAMRFLLPFLPILLSIGPLSAQTWEPVGSGASSTVYALEPFGGELFAGGVFTEIGGVNTDYLARWDGTAWSSIGNLAVYMSADGLYANDTALFIGDGGRVRFWNGINMFNLTGVNSSSFNSQAYSMAHFQDTLYVGGVFSSPFAHIARWNGSSYEGLTSGTSGRVTTMAPFDDQLFVGGGFFTAGDSVVHYTALWNGSAWNCMGAGVNGDVYIHCIFQDTLYIGGDFTQANGQPASRVAKWNGSQWVNVGGTLNDYVTAMTVYRDQLYIGGSFTSPSRIARLSGNSWVPVGSGCNSTVKTMEVFHDSLFVGGLFTMAGGDSAKHIAKWHLPEAPVAAFTVGSGTLCPNECTSFTDNSPNGVSSWAWSFPGGTPATSTDSMPMVCYATPGTYPVTLTVTNVGGSDSTTDSAAVLVDICSGIEHSTIVEDILVRHDPVQPSLHLKLPGKGGIAVMDAQGRVVLAMHSTSAEQVLDIADLPAGTYVVRFSGEGRVASAKFVKE
ncbi:MAG: T9SS type A sorting domain-containing protein [Flavobacteriales bacterium]|nr:T9SS type A sorting domain-containing protein [Flavobacteriales bacterium]